MALLREAFSEAIPLYGGLLHLVAVRVFAHSRSCVLWLPWLIPTFHLGPHPTPARLFLPCAFVGSFVFRSRLARTRVARTAVLRHSASAAQLPGDVGAGVPCGRALCGDRGRGRLLRCGAPLASASRARSLHWFHCGERLVSSLVAGSCWSVLHGVRSTVSLWRHGISTPTLPT